MNDRKLLFLKHQGKLLALLIKNGKLFSVRVYEEEKESLVGNLYVGKVLNLSENIGAAFVEIASGVSCFLPLNDVGEATLFNREHDGRLRPGDELLVQVVRDAFRNKQPVVTAKISLAGQYLVASADSDKLGISTKLPESRRKAIISFLLEQNLIDEQHKCKASVGMIVRTNAGSLEAFTPLLSEWERLSAELSDIMENAAHRTCFSCLKKQEKPYLSDLKEYYSNEFDEIVTDCADLYEELVQNAKSRESQGLFIPPVRLYRDEYPLSKLYSVSSQLEEALGSRVWLKSGGYLIIEPTEALTVIDVNTGKCEKGRSSEETYFHINMEACEEIARQLRLRNVSGIIIVDFINMADENKKKELLSSLKTHVRQDFIKTNVIDITPLGLVELTRKRISRPLQELL